MKNSLIERVLGREGEAAPVAPSLPADVDQPVRKSRADYDEEAGTSDVEAVPSQQVVQMLAQAWKSGQQNDVASQLLFTPVSYADFVKLCFVIGQGDAVQLGLMLDDMAESEGMVTDEPSENRILARVGQQRQGPDRPLDAGPQEDVLLPEEQQEPEEQAVQPPPRQ